MGEARRGIRPAVLWASIGAVVCAGLLFWRVGGERGDVPGPVSASSPVPGGAAPEAARPGAAGAPGPARRDPERAAAAERQDAGAEPDESEGVFDVSALAWSQVDLETVRAALPDNLYWERSAPTRDPEVLRQREESRQYWNTQYGKVLSNTGSEEEVRAYYAHRQRVSTDAIEFTTYLLQHYGDVLPERDVGLLRLALRLHLARIEELPRNLSDALARREAHEQVRREWLEQQQLFEDRGSDGSPSAER